jgi:hypothetical protein
MKNKRNLKFLFSIAKSSLKKHPTSINLESKLGCNEQENGNTNIEGRYKRNRYTKGEERGAINGIAISGKPHRTCLQKTK